MSKDKSTADNGTAAGNNTDNSDVKDMSFEAALSALEEIVRKLESGEVDLDDAIQAYARGAALKSHCEEKLTQAQARVDKISLDAKGNPTATQVDM